MSRPEARHAYVRRRGGQESFPPSGSDLLSEELDKFGRDRIYEDAVRSTY